MRVGECSCIPLSEIHFLKLSEYKLEKYDVYFCTLCCILRQCLLSQRRHQPHHSQGRQGDSYMFCWLPRILRMKYVKCRTGPAFPKEDLVMHGGIYKTLSTNYLGECTDQDDLLDKGRE